MLPYQVDMSDSPYALTYLDLSDPAVSIPPVKTRTVKRAGANYELQRNPLTLGPGNKIFVPVQSYRQIREDRFTLPGQEPLSCRIQKQLMAGKAAQDGQGAGANTERND